MALFYIQIEGVNIVRGCTRKSYVAMVLFCSMSKKRRCYDNAAMESWNHSFKVEAILGSDSQREQVPLRKF